MDPWTVHGNPVQCSALFVIPNARCNHLDPRGNPRWSAVQLLLFIRRGIKVVVGIFVTVRCTVRDRTKTVALEIVNIEAGMPRFANKHENIAALHSVPEIGEKILAI